jgi:hypothetical protein
MRKIDVYKVKSGVNLGSSKFWNGIFEDIDLRIHARELDAEAINKAADELIAVGIARVNVTFNPLIQQSTQAMQDAIALLAAAQQQVADTIAEVNGELQTFLDETASQVQAILAGGVDGGTIEEPTGAKIKLLRSTVSGHAPAALESGQLAVNEADGKLFYRTAAGGVGEMPLNVAAFVATQINALKGEVGSALDTLDELAAALGDDANFSSTVTTALGNRLRVDVSNQGLTQTQKDNALTNLGAGSAATRTVGTAATNIVALDASQNATFPATINCVDLNYTSDARLKEIIGSLSREDAVSILSALNVVIFQFRRDPSRRDHYGVIAQEVAKIVPSLVTEIDDPNGEFGKIMTVDWAGITAIILACTQWLIADHDNLAERVARIEQRFGD